VQAPNLTAWGLEPNELASELGIDSIGSYVWIHNDLMTSFPASSYVECADSAVGLWDELNARFSVPYYPNVTMGWDPSPRTDQDKELVQGDYPNTAILVGNTPKAFEQSLREAEKFVNEAIPEGKPKIGTAPVF
jgi:hypothetical protein